MLIFRHVKDEMEVLVMLKRVFAITVWISICACVAIGARIWADGAELFSSTDRFVTLILTISFIVSALMGAFLIMDEKTES